MASKLLYAHRTLNGTRWFRKTFKKAFSLFESYLILFTRNYSLLVFSFILKRIH